MVNLDKFRMGYFILWKHKSGFVGNRIVKEQLKRGLSKEASQYTHVDVSGGGPYAVRVMPPKTKIIHILDYYRKREFCVVRYRNPVYQKMKRYKVAFWAASHCNLTYDYLGIIKFRIGAMFHKKDWYFCSENSLWALQVEFPKAMGFKLPHECVPGDFYPDGESEFEIVYKGETD